MGHWLTSYYPVSFDDEVIGIGIVVVDVTERKKAEEALRFAAEYELLLTQRLVLQPSVKASLYGKRDPERSIGAGLSDLEAGLRLRYEITRKFAPYIGVVWNRKFGGTAAQNA